MTGRDESESSREQYERDIQDALRQAGAHRLPPRWTRRSSTPRLDVRPTPVQVLVAGGILLLLNWLRLTFFLGELAGPLGLALLAVGCVAWLLRPRRRESYWRGRRIELDPEGGWWERVYLLFFRP